MRRIATCFGCRNNVDCKWYEETCQHLAAAFDVDAEPRTLFDLQGIYYLALNKLCSTVSSRCDRLVPMETQVEPPVRTDPFDETLFKVISRVQGVCRSSLRVYGAYSANGRIISLVGIEGEELVLGLRVSTRMQLPPEDEERWLQVIADEWFEALKAEEAAEPA